MPQSIPKGLTTSHALAALRDLDAGEGQRFGAPTVYELLHEGRRYPPKAVVGLAFRHLNGSILPPEAFSGGEAPGQANYVLRQLGFVVEKKGEPVEEPKPSSDWSEEEVSLIVADYFDMLRLDLADKSFNKAEHNRSLRERLNGRSKSSVEFKHQNISAVLLEMRHPYIDGYKPARNYQRRVLPEAVQAYLDAHPDLQELLAASPVLNPTKPHTVERSVEGYFESPPEQMPAQEPFSKPWLSRRGRKVDYARRDAINRQLGRLGEEFAVQVEKQRLANAGRDDLAAKVEWVSETCGDGLGFDILSFDELGERYLEVKTTSLGKEFPFIVTDNELRCSEDLAERFDLYRVFRFHKGPGIYVLSGALSKTCSLEVVQYRASVNDQKV